MGNKAERKRVEREDKQVRDNIDLLKRRRRDAEEAAKKRVETPNNIPSIKFEDPTEDNVPSGALDFFLSAIQLAHGSIDFQASKPIISMTLYPHDDMFYDWEIEKPIRINADSSGSTIECATLLENLPYNLKIKQTARNLVRFQNGHAPDVGSYELGKGAAGTPGFILKAEKGSDLQRAGSLIEALDLLTVSVYQYAAALILSDYGVSRVKDQVVWDWLEQYKP
jgi:hypothetical protein